MRVFIYKKNHIVNAAAGAEKVMCSMANFFAGKGDKVMLATRDTTPGRPFYPLHEQVEFRQIEHHYPKWKRLFGKLFFGLGIIDKFPSFDREKIIADGTRKVIDDFAPDVIVATGLSDLVDLAYKQDFHIPVVMTLHCSPVVDFDTRPMLRRLYHMVLEKTDAVQVLVPSFKEDMRPYYGGRVEVIGNAVSVPEFSRDFSASGHCLAMTARFEKNKNQELVIRAFARLTKRFPEWKVKFFGNNQGEYGAYCKQLAEDLGCADKIDFCGVVTNPQEYLKKADIFVFPSLFEGFPCSLVEAMAVELPSLVLKSCSGVNEIVIDGENGFQAENNDDFEAKLALLMADVSLREKLGRRARKDVLPFAEAEIWQKWDDLLHDLMQNKK